MNGKHFHNGRLQKKQDKEMYLQPNGKLDWTKPTAANSFSEYTSDPAQPVPYKKMFISTGQELI